MEEWWEKAQKVGTQGGEVVLKKVIESFGDVTHMVKDLGVGVNKVVDETREIRLQIEKKVDIHHLAGLLQTEIEKVYKELQDVALDELPENRGERAMVRAKILGQVMEKVGVAYIQTSVTAGVPREQAEVQFNGLSPKFTHVLMIAGLYRAHVGLWTMLMMSFLL